MPGVDVTKAPFLNTSRSRQNGWHFADNIFKCIFSDENIWILINILLKFIPKGRINIIAALVQIMAWCRPGDRPLSETMMVSLLMHICITWPQWVNICIKERFNFAKVYIKSFQSQSYLSGVFMGKLQRHLSNMNLILDRKHLFDNLTKQGNIM